ncbi:MAG TPA: ABC transporter permease, partial [Thermoanaerobaculia bacterium]
MSETALPIAAAAPRTRIREPRRLSLGAKLSLGWEIVKGGLVELWAHKLRSTLTLTLLMLGVFALVVMSSVLDGVMDKIATGFSGMSWDGTIMVAPDSPETTEEQKRFAMSPGLRFEDLPRLTAPNEKVLAYLPRATKESAVKIAGGTERCWVNGVWPDYARWMNRTIAMGRGLTDDDERRRSTVAVVGGTLGSKLFGGADPIGRDITVEGVRFRVVGVQAPSQIFSEDLWYDSNGITIPLQTYMDRIDPDHKLSSVTVKLVRKRDNAEVSAMMVGRTKQAHHGIEDAKIVDLEAESVRAWA